MGVYESKKPTKDGRKFYFRCYYKDRYGNNKQYESKKYKGIRECEKAEREFLSTIQYEDVPDYDISFKIVYDEFLDFKGTQVKSSSYYSRKHRDDLHIIPFFEKYKLHSIKINDVLRWKEKINDLKISIGHKNRIITDLKDILTYARDNYEFDGKVLSKLQKYKIESVPQEKESVWNYWTYEEFKKFISVVDDEFYNLIFSFLYFTGLRLGECIALNWQDINFEKGELRVNKTLTNKVYNKTFIITAPKTNNSIRFIELDDNLLRRLKEHYDREKKIYGFNKNMFMFGNIKYVSPTTFKRYLYYYQQKAGVKKITPHGFRHSHASLLINLGLDFEDVAERLGDTVRMVQDTYYHMYPQKKSNTVKALNNLN